MGCHCEERSDDAISIARPGQSGGDGRAVTFVMTLIAGPAGGEALPGIVAALAAALPLAGAPDWLAPGLACDLALGKTDTQAAERLARAAFGDTAVDVLVQPA